MVRGAREHLNASARRSRMNPEASTSQANQIPVMSQAPQNPPMPQAIQNPDAESSRDASFPGDNTLPHSAEREESRARRKEKGKQKVVINPRRDRYVPQLDGPRPGGPQIPELLISYDAHVACFLWANATVEHHDRGVLKIHHKVDPIKSWEREGEGRLWLSVKRSGLAHLRQCVHKHIDEPLLSAFVEHWHPETNSFHFSWGEMTIMLQDVRMILNLRIDGESVEPSGKMAKLTSHQEKEELAEFLHLDVDELKKEMDKHNIKFSTPQGVGQELARVDDRAAAYLLYLVSATIFADKSVDRATHKFFPLIREVKKVHNYAWGAAALATLYRRLGQASRQECKQFCGSATLLQVT